MSATTPAIADFYHKGVLWSPSYFADSVGGASISVVQYFLSFSDMALAQFAIAVITPPVPSGLQIAFLGTWLLNSGCVFANVSNLTQDASM